MTYLLFATALGLSAVAAYYSIMGLVAIFAAAAVPIFIMGSLLEASKLVVASWLYRSWKKIPKLMMLYFTVALVILMMLTSMGIFGYLSKAHLDQAVPTGDVAAKLALIDEKIKTEKENLNANRTELNQMDQQVNETISRSAGKADGGSSGVERSIAIRKAQQKDRARILSEIGTTQAKIAKLQEERSPIASEVRKVEAEVGPIKYIAALIYGDSASEEILEKAVRIVIIMIVMVFDPLAVLLLIAANWQKRQEDEEEGDSPLRIQETEQPTVTELSVVGPIEEPTISPEPEKVQVENDAIDEIIAETVEEEPEVQPEVPTKDWEPEFYDRVSKELGRYETDLLEQERKRKMQSFLDKVGTIEDDVEKLQK